MHNQRVTDAVSRIHPEIRCCLGAGIGRYQNIIGGILLINSKLCGKRSIDIDSQRRRIRHLKNVRVGNARHTREITRQLRASA